MEPSWLGGASTNMVGFGARGIWVQVPALYLSSFAFLGKSLSFSKPQFVHLLKL